MLARYRDFDSAFAVIDQLLSRSPYDARRGDADARPFAREWRRLGVDETDSALVLTLDVPGLNEKDISVALHNGTLHIRGERKTGDVGEAKAFRFAGLQFEKRFSLPYKVDADATTASVKDGVLTITLPKAAEAKPRAIAVTGELAPVASPQIDNHPTETT